MIKNFVKILESLGDRLEVCVSVVIRSWQHYCNYPLTLCPLENFLAFLPYANLFQNHLFRKILPGIQSECQTDWVQIRPDIFGLDLGPNCLKTLSAEDTRR